MDGIAKCHACDSTLAANLECPDCGTPEDEDEALNDYVCWNEQEATATPPEPSTDRSYGAQHTGSCRVLPFPKPDPAPPGRRRRRCTAPVLRSSSVLTAEATRHAPSIRTL